MSKKTLKLIFRVALSLAALYLILLKVDLEQAWNYLQNAQWLFIGLAFLSFFISKVIAAFRLNLLYRTQDLRIHDRLNLKLNFLGMFYNLFIPLVGGEGYKVYWIRKHFTAKVKPLVWAALLDRASGLAALILVTGGFFMLSSYQLPFKPAFLLIIPLAYAVHFAVTHWFFRSYQPAWVSTHLLSLAIQLLQALTTFFVVLGLGIHNDMLDYIFVFMLASFAFVLPMVGAREMAFVFGAEYLGLNMELSLAISLLFYLCLAANSLLGSYFLLRPRSLRYELSLLEAKA